MKNKKKMTILIIQLIALALFVFSYKSYTDSIIKPISVYDFSRQISEGVKIEEKDLKLSSVAANSYTKNMILASDVSSIIGQYTTTTVFPDTHCYLPQFGTLNQSNSMFASLDLTNAVILEIGVDMADVGGYLKDGDRINLMFSANGEASIINVNSSSSETSEENSSSSESFLYSKIFLQDIVVYKVLSSSGYKYAERTERYSGETARNINASDPTSVDDGSIAAILVIVSPEEAEEIKTRELAGEITVLKRFDETETHDTLGYIIGNYGKVFAGNANAETSSLQIISTIQDTDVNDDTYTTNSTSNTSNVLTTAGVGNSTSNSSNNSTNKSTNSNTTNKVSTTNSSKATGIIGTTGVN